MNKTGKTTIAHLRDIFVQDKSRKRHSEGSINPRNVENFEFLHQQMELQRSEEINISDKESYNSMRKGSNFSDSEVVLCTTCSLLKNPSQLKPVSSLPSQESAQNTSITDNVNSSQRYDCYSPDNAFVMFDSNFASNNSTNTSNNTSNNSNTDTDDTDTVRKLRGKSSSCQNMDPQANKQKLRNFLRSKKLTQMRNKFLEYLSESYIEENFLFWDCVDHILTPQSNTPVTPVATIDTPRDTSIDTPTDTVTDNSTSNITTEVDVASTPDDSPLDSAMDSPTELPATSSSPTILSATEVTTIPSSINSTKMSSPISIKHSSPTGEPSGMSSPSQAIHTVQEISCSPASSHSLFSSSSQRKGCDDHLDFVSSAPELSDRESPTFSKKKKQRSHHRENSIASARKGDSKDSFNAASIRKGEKITKTFSEPTMANTRDAVHQVPNVEEPFSIYTLFLAQESKYALHLSLAINSELDEIFVFNDDGYNSKGQMLAEVDKRLIASLLMQARDCVEETLTPLYIEFCKENSIVLESVISAVPKRHKSQGSAHRFSILQQSDNGNNAQGFCKCRKGNTKAIRKISAASVDKFQLRQKTSSALSPRARLKT